MYICGAKAKECTFPVISTTRVHVNRLTNTILKRKQWHGWSTEKQPLSHNNNPTTDQVKCLNLGRTGNVYRRTGGRIIVFTSCYYNKSKRDPPNEYGREGIVRMTRVAAARVGKIKPQRPTPEIELYQGLIKYLYKRKHTFQNTGEKMFR